MTTLDFQALILLLLRFTSEGKEHSLKEVIERLFRFFGLTGDERKELFPSDSQTRFDNRIGWINLFTENGFNRIPSPRSITYNQGRVTRLRRESRKD